MWTGFITDTKWMTRSSRWQAKSSSYARMKSFATFAKSSYSTRSIKTTVTSAARQSTRNAAASANTFSSLGIGTSASSIWSVWRSFISETWSLQVLRHFKSGNGKLARRKSRWKQQKSSCKFRNTIRITSRREASMPIFKSAKSNKWTRLPTRSERLTRPGRT